MSHNGQGFRDYQVAAPLKQRGASGKRAELLGFRDYQVAAPLKHSLRLSCRSRHVGFRDYQVAAPLKPPDRPRPHQPQRRFPRLSSRGPIEATLGRRR